VTRGNHEAPTKALLFADANFLAHVSRQLEIGKILRDERGFDVRFAADGPYVKLLREAGFEVDYVYTVPKDTTLELARRASVMDPFWWHKTVMRSIRSDVDVIRKHRPDVVVGDMHWSLRASAVECGVPYVSVVNGAWMRNLDHKLRAFDDHFLTTLFGVKFAERSLPFLKRQLLSLWAFPYRMWKKQGDHAVAVETLYDILEGDLTLLADIPEFCPTKDLPDNARYVGPILWNVPLPEPGFLSRLDPDRPTIYVSMGSTGKKSFFEMSLAAFTGTPYQVVMTTGEIELAKAKAPENFFITDFAPGLAIMKRSDLVLNHGGNGTIYQALTAGIPIVGIPTHVDQQLQLQLCERWGVGKKLREKTVSAEVLRAAADEIVGNYLFRINAERMAQAIARYDGPRLAARAIDEFLRERRGDRVPLRKAS
jgi:MGT family glycosyltransferase